MNNTSKLKPFFMIACALLAALASACSAEPEPEGNSIDLSASGSAGSVVSAEQLMAAFESGEVDTVTLDASIDMGDDILRLDKEGATMTINGNGNSISGNGDCVIRLAGNCRLVLNDVGVKAGLNAIGCMGDAYITGDADIIAVAHGVYAKGHVTLGEGSRFYIKSNVGNGIQSAGLELGEDARVLAQGGLGGVHITKDDIVLNGLAVLDSNTEDNYNALKCEGMLIMMDGSSLKVTNGGEYHGAEISGISIEGVVNIEAVGGSKGVGLFLFELEEELYVIGSCEPGLRNEVGSGSITFVKDESEFPAEPEPTQTAGDAGPEDESGGE